MFPRNILLDVTLLTRSSIKPRGLGHASQWPTSRSFTSREFWFKYKARSPPGARGPACWDTATDLSKKVGQRDENTYIPKMDGQTDVSAVLRCQILGILYYTIYYITYTIYYITLYTILHYIMLYYNVI